MASEAKYTISLKDKTQGAFNGINRGLGKLQNNLKKTSRQMTTLGKSMSMGLTAPLVAAGAGFLKLAADQEKALILLNQAVRSTGGAAGYTTGELQKMSQEFQGMTTFGDEAIQRAQAQLLTFTKIGGEAFKGTLEAAMDLSMAMDQDLKSSVIMLGKALNDPVANLSALSRAGIQFTKDQKDVIKGLWEGGHAAEAQALILKELNVQFGGQAQAAASGYAGKLIQVKNIMGDVGERIGAILMPYFYALAKTLKNVAEWMGALSTETIKTGIKVLAFAAAVGPVVLILGKLASALAFLTSPIGLVVAGLATMVLAWKKWGDKIQPIVEHVKNFVADNFDVMISYMTEWARSWVDTIKEVAWGLALFPGPLRNTWAVIYAELEKSSVTLGNFAVNVRESGAATKYFGDKYEALAEFIGSAVDVMKGWAASLEVTDESMMKLIASGELLQQNLTDVGDIGTESLKEVENVGVEAAKTLETSFVNSLDVMKLHLMNWSEWANGILSQVANRIFQISVLEPLAQGASAAIGGYFSNIGSGTKYELPDGFQGPVMDKSSTSGSTSDKSYSQTSGGDKSAPIVVNLNVKAFDGSDAVTTLMANKAVISGIIEEGLAKRGRRL